MSPDHRIITKQELLHKFEQEGWPERLALGVVSGKYARTELKLEHKTITIWFDGENFKCIHLQYSISVVIRQLLDDDGVTWAVP
jgi:hypothetical protein